MRNTERVGPSMRGTWNDGKVSDQHVATPIDMHKTCGGLWATRGRHSLMPWDRNQDLNTDPNPTVEMSRDVVTDEIYMDPPNRDTSGPLRE